MKLKVKATILVKQNKTCFSNFTRMQLLGGDICFRMNSGISGIVCQLDILKVRTRNDENCLLQAGP